MHIAEPLGPEPNPFEVQTDTEKSKKYKWPDTDHILAELIQAGVETLHPEINKLITFI
jgi:hypothetical protein